MPAPFSVKIMLPGKVVYDGEAVSLVVPAGLGYLGILAHHAPIIAELKPGNITLRDTVGKTANFSLDANGLLEFSDNRATLILDSPELPS